MDIQAPYEPGTPDPIFVGGDADAGGRDIVAGSVAEAVANAQARFGEMQADTFGQGSQVGDNVTLPGPPPPFEEMYFPETNQGPPGGGS
jgi:hypothetical protein